MSTTILLDSTPSPDDLPLYTVKSAETAAQVQFEKEFNNKADQQPDEPVQPNDESVVQSINQSIGGKSINLVPQIPSPYIRPRSPSVPPDLAATNIALTHVTSQPTDEPKGIMNKAKAMYQKHQANIFVVWRFLDSIHDYVRVLIMPMIAWCIGALHMNFAFAIVLAFLWHYSVKLGRFFPKPPPVTHETNVLQAIADDQAADESLPSPKSPEASPRSDAEIRFAEMIKPAVSPFAQFSFIPSLLTEQVLDFPQWFDFPDVERTKWLNDLLQILWPHACAAVKGEVAKKIDPILAKFKGFVVISSLDLGSQPPFVGGIKVYETHDSTVMLDIDINMALEPNIVIEARWKKFALPVTVDAVTVSMTARIVLSDLVGKLPCFRFLGVSLAGKPQILPRVSVFGVNFFDIPIMGSFIQHLIEDVAMTMFGWPKELRIPVMVETEAEVAARNKTEPKGLLHVYLMSCSNLKNVDIAPFGKSDPYCILKVSDQVQTSRVIDNNLNPVWNDDFEFIVYEPDSEVLTVGVVDQDMVRVPNPLASKRLGDVTFPIKQLLSEGFQDVTLPLNHTKQGSIRFQCEWRPFAPRKSRSSRRANMSTDSDGNAASNSVLFVSGLRAYDLPVDNCYLKFTVSSTKKKTAIAPTRGNEFEFEERFSFPIFNADVEKVRIQLRYDDRLGKFTSFASKTASLGRVKDVKTKSLVLGEIEIDVREVARTGSLSDDFVIPLTAGVKSFGRPRLHVSFLLRELAASQSVKQRSMSKIAIPGTLNVTLISASNLIAVDRGGASDPFVQFTCGLQTAKSSVKKKTIEPVWNESFSFKISDLMRDDLFLSIKDWDSVEGVPLMGSLMGSMMNKVTMKSDRLGDIRIPLRLFYPALSSGEACVKQLPLQHTKQGTVKLSMQFKPNEGVIMPVVNQGLLAGSSFDLLRMNSMSSGDLTEDLASIDEALNQSINESINHSNKSLVDSNVTPIVTADLSSATTVPSASLQTHTEMKEKQNIENERVEMQNEPLSPEITSIEPVISPSHNQSLNPSATPSRRASIDTTSNRSPSFSQSTAGHHSRHLSNTSLSSDVEIDTVHIDQSTLTGWLCLTIHSATGLPVHSKPSYYVKVGFGKTNMHTGLSKMNDPVWDAEFRLPIHSSEYMHPNSALLRLRVKNQSKRLFAANELLGESDVLLTQLAEVVKKDCVSTIDVQHRPLTLLDRKKNPSSGALIISAHFERHQPTTPIGQQETIEQVLEDEL